MLTFKISGFYDEAYTIPCESGYIYIPHDFADVRELEGEFCDVYHEVLEKGVYGLVWLSFSGRIHRVFYDPDVGELPAVVRYLNKLGVKFVRFSTV